MSKYTTGEMAKLCDVSVRTVQYYDTREILVPSELSEGGRRLYTEDDVRRLRIICFLRDAGMPIKAIGELLQEEHPESVISELLNEQASTLQEEIAEREAQLNKIAETKKYLSQIAEFSLESIDDVAQIMSAKEDMKHVRKMLIAGAVPFAIAQWLTFLLGLFQHVWWPFLAYTVLSIPCIAAYIRFYWTRVSYICPACHETFKPHMKEFFLGKHTPTTRKLTCTCCGHHGFCVETVAKRPDHEK